MKKEDSLIISFPFYFNSIDTVCSPMCLGIWVLKLSPKEYSVWFIAFKTVSMLLSLGDGFCIFFNPNTFKPPRGLLVCFCLWFFVLFCFYIGRLNCVISCFWCSLGKERQLIQRRPYNYHQWHCYEVSLLIIVWFLG